MFRFTIRDVLWLTAVGGDQWWLSWQGWWEHQALVALAVQVAAFSCAGE